MKEIKYVKKSPEVERTDKVKSDCREVEKKRFEEISLSRPSCGCGCAPYAKEK